MKNLLIVTLAAVLAVTGAAPAFAMSQDRLSMLNDLLTERAKELLLPSTPKDGPYNGNIDTGNNVMQPPQGCLNATVAKDAHGKPIVQVDSQTGKTFVMWHCDN